MRPRIVDTLNTWFGTELFTWLVPDPAFVYALAMAAVAFVFVRRTLKDNLDRYHALGAVIWGIVGGLIGARVFFLIQHVDLLLARPSIVFDLNGGTVSWGAYLGGALGFVLYLRRQRQPAMRYLDVLASCLGLGPFIARWACFLNGDDYGTLSDAPWAVSFPHGSYPFAAQVQAGLLDPLAELSLPVHPVQIYLSLKGLLLFVVCSALWKRSFPPGVLFGVYWVMFGVVRFVIEFFRGDVSRGFIGALSVGQVMSLTIVVVAGAMLAYIGLQRGTPVVTHTLPSSHSAERAERSRM
jgi:phosphatidylglycerol:prolipoprotein diacylglycerol transferase